MNILLVGSGPASYICLKTLLEISSLNIVLIDNSNYQPEQKDKECIYQSNFINKSRLIDNKIFEINNPQLDKLLTKSFGGLSTVWGSAVHDLLDYEKEIYKKLNIDIEKYFNELDDKLLFLTNQKNKLKNTISFPESTESDLLLKKLNNNSKINARHSKFLINFKNSRDFSLCKFCGSFKLMCSTGSLWSSKEEIYEHILNKDIEYLPNHKLIQFTEKGENVQCEILHNNKMKKLSFDYLFIGAGAFSTSEIFLNSNLVSNVEINHSDLHTIPFIKKTNNNKSPMSHPVVFISGEAEKKLFFSQLYFYSDSLLKIYLDNPYIYKIIKKFPNFIKNYFGGMRLFVDPSVSSKIVLNKINGVINKKIVEYDFESQKKVKKKFLKNLNRRGIINLSFFSNNVRNGESYHFGSQFKPNNKTIETSSDNLGRVGNLKKTFVIDSSVLPVVNTGPITYTVMANSLRITKEFIKKFILFRN